MADKYILNGKTPVRCDDLKTWAIQYGESDRYVAQDMIGDARVSTIFLGIDHGYGGRPLLFETMIFGGPHDQFQDRCSTWDEAEKMHDQAVALARSALN